MPKYIDLSLSFDGISRFKIGFSRDRCFDRDGRQATSYSISAHAYTHIDAPLHFIQGGKSIDAFPVETFIGEAVLLDIPKNKDEGVTAEDMERAGKHARDGDIVLIRTGWLEKMWGKTEYDDAPYMTVEAADWLIRLKAKMVGYDFPSDYKERDFFQKGYVKTEELVVHLKLLRQEVLHLENLNHLSKISKTRFQLIALPILLKDCDGAPCRPVAIED